MISNVTNAGKKREGRIIMKERYKEKDKRDREDKRESEKETEMREREREREGEREIIYVIPRLYIFSNYCALVIR